LQPLSTRDRNGQCRDQKAETTRKITDASASTDGRVGRERLKANSE
jgi:hypothetical protein